MTLRFLHHRRWCYSRCTTSIGSTTRTTRTYCVGMDHSVRLQRNRPYHHHRPLQQQPPQCGSGLLFSTKTTVHSNHKWSTSPEPQHVGVVLLSTPTTPALQQQQQQLPTERRKQLIASKIYMNVGGDESHVQVLHDLITLAQTTLAKPRSPPEDPPPDMLDDTFPSPSPPPSPPSPSSPLTTTTTTNTTTTAAATPSTTTTTSHTTVNDETEPNFTKVGALVQVHMDPYSNRSSLHIAGPVLDVIAVTQKLIETAKQAFSKLKRGCKLPTNVKSLKAAHKVVDILEQVAFVPLLPEPQSKITENKQLFPPAWVPTYAAYAARQVGPFIRETLETQVFYYEYAQRNNLSFDTIVHRRTRQFGELKNNIPESILVGAFPDYIEDVHILLAAQCGKQRVRDLVQLLNNSTEIGLTDVVATAQMYDVFRWDIHCRLLRPHLTGSNMAAIEHVTKQWNELQKGRNDQIPIEFVIKCFRVGPTYDECISALQKVGTSENDRNEFDQDVRKAFQNEANYYTTSSSNYNTDNGDT